MSESTREKGKRKKSKDAGSDIPDGWVEKYSEKKGKVFYKHKESGETSWTIPEAPAAAGAGNSSKSKDKDRDKNKDKNKDKDKEKSRSKSISGVGKLKDRDKEREEGDAVEDSKRDKKEDKATRRSSVKGAPKEGKEGKEGKASKREKEKEGRKSRRMKADASSEEQESEEEVEVKKTSKKDKEKKKNKDSKESAEPAAKSSSSSSSAAKSNWVEKYSEKKRKPFWKNKVTGETTWNNPLPEEEEEDDEKEPKSKGKEKEKEGKARDRGDGKDEDRGRRKSRGKASNSNSSQRHSSDYSGSRSRSRSWSRSRSRSVSRSTSYSRSRSRSRSFSGSDTEEEGLVSAMWEEKYSAKKNKPYWKNKDTGESTWVKPANNFSSSSGAVGKGKDKSKEKKKEKVGKDEDRGRKADKKKYRKNDTRDGSFSRSRSRSYSRSGSSRSRSRSRSYSRSDSWSRSGSDSSSHSDSADQKRFSTKTQGKNVPKEKESSDKDTAGVDTVDATDKADDDELSVATPESAEEKQLPVGWEIRHSKTKNKHYYVNAVLKKSQWHFPDASDVMTTAAASSASPEKSKGVVAGLAGALQAVSGSPARRLSAFAAASAAGGGAGPGDGKDPLAQLGANRDEIRASISNSKSFWTQQNQNTEKEVSKTVKADPVVAIDRAAMQQRKSLIQGLAGGLEGGVPLGGAMPPGYLNKRKSLQMEAEARAALYTITDEVEEGGDSAPHGEHSKIQQSKLSGQLRPASERSIQSLDSDAMEDAYSAYDMPDENMRNSWTGDLLPDGDANDADQYDKYGEKTQSGRMRAITEERLSAYIPADKPAAPLVTVAGTTLPLAAGKVPATPPPGVLAALANARPPPRPPTAGAGAPKPPAPGNPLPGPPAGLVPPGPPRGGPRGPGPPSAPLTAARAKGKVPPGPPGPPQAGAGGVPGAPTPGGPPRSQPNPPPQPVASPAPPQPRLPRAAPPAPAPPRGASWIGS